MNESWFTLLSRAVERDTGVFIDPAKQYLAESRLGPVVQRNGSNNIAELVEMALAEGQSTLRRAVVEAMMTGETFFFREASAFDFFRDTILPELVIRREGERRLRILSAACASGQEAYTIAMILDDFSTRLRGWRVELIASDVSSASIARASEGTFNQFEVQRGLPIALLLRYFHREGDHWRIAEHLRSRIEFRQESILEPSRETEPYDIVFCRNVLMYFSEETRRRALQNLKLRVSEDGWLVLGSSETGFIGGKTAPFAKKALSIYARVPDRSLPTAEGPQKQQSTRLPVSQRDRAAV